MPLNVLLNQPGSYTIEDDGIPGNNTSVVRRDSDGVVVLMFTHAADTNTFTTIAGVHLTINFTDSFGAADVTIGNIANTLQSPDSIVVNNVRTTGNVILSSRGAITERGSDAGADIIAGTLVMSAESGIGSPGNALETQTGFLEAETVTGGINIANFGTVFLGGISALVDGLDVVTSGDLVFTNLGTINLSDETALESIHGGNSSGDVALTAIGAASDIVATVDQQSITVPGGNLFLAAGRDIAFGVSGAGFNNDVFVSGSINATAGRDLLVDGSARLLSDVGGVTGGNLVVNAGRDIAVLATSGSGASLAAAGNGDVILTTGPGGTLTLNRVNAVETTSGDVIVNADRLLISSASAAILANNGQVVLRTSTFGRAIDLGSATDAAFALEISDAELDRISTPNLTIGGDNVGALTVEAPISPLNALNLTLYTPENLDVLASILVGGSLTLAAGNDLAVIGITSINAGGAFTAFVDLVGNDGGVGGNSTITGAVNAASVTVTGNAEADTLDGSGENDTLLGLGGNDTLHGGFGADTLDGGTGDDTMLGGVGNDVYFVDSAGDVVTEAVGEGIDEVRTAIGSRTVVALVYTLPANVENLTGTSAGAQGVVGNALDNIIAMGNAGDLIVLHDGGSDTVTGGGGNDFIYYGAAFASIGDSNDGGAGFDTVGLLGTYNISFGTNDLVGIEKLAMYSSGGGPPNNYTIAMNDANVASGASMLVVALSLQATETFVFNGAAETNGIFNVRGGRGNDTITAGAGNDQVFGNLGADSLTGGGGNDFFEYYATTHSTAAAMDTIQDFTLGDKINLFVIDADGNAGNGNQSFAFIGSGAFTNTAGQVRAYQSGGPGSWFVEADVNGDSIADLMIALTVTGGHTLTAGDFIL